MKRIITTVFLVCALNSIYAQNIFPNPGRVGIGTISPVTALQIGAFNNSASDNQLLIPGVYGFEQVRLGQISNGNSGLEFVNHTNLTDSYGIKFLVDTDHGAPGMQLQYASPVTSYESLSYSTGFYMNTNGGIGINTTFVPSEFKLAVAGNMIAESVKVKLRGAWPDYVFTKDYELPSLKETEKHIKENGHLPGIPSAAEVKADGIDLGVMNAKLLQKIEELTLYLIERDRKSESQQLQIDELKKQMAKMVSDRK